MTELERNRFIPDEIPLSSFNFLDSYASEHGAEKNIYKVEFAGMLFAAKLYKTNPDFIDTTLLDINADSREELALYRMLTTTPVGIYVPDAFGLIVDEEGSGLGLAVEWIDNYVLSDVFGRERPLCPAVVDEFERRLLETTMRGIHLGSDMYSEGNLMVSQGSEQRLWFAECLTRHVDEKFTSGELIKRAMQTLRNDYVAFEDTGAEDVDVEQREMNRIE